MFKVIGLVLCFSNNLNYSWSGDCFHRLSPEADLVYFPSQWISKDVAGQGADFCRRLLLERFVCLFTVLSFEWCGTWEKEELGLRKCCLLNYLFICPWDLSSLTRDRTCAPYSGSTGVLNTGRPGNYPQNVAFYKGFISLGKWHWRILKLV